MGSGPRPQPGNVSHLQPPCTNQWLVGVRPSSFEESADVGREQAVQTAHQQLGGPVFLVGLWIQFDRIDQKQLCMGSDLLQCFSGLIGVQSVIHPGIDTRGMNWVDHIDVKAQAERFLVWRDDAERLTDDGCNPFLVDLFR